MDLNETICFCADVTAGDIKKAYDEGHTTVDAIGEATEAGTLCGGCQDRIAELLEEFEMCIRDSHCCQQSSIIFFLHLNLLILLLLIFIYYF